MKQNIAILDITIASVYFLEKVVSKFGFQNMELLQ